jgi:hypothetical protein
MQSREPTANEAAGMEWWNSLTETERAKALEAAGWKPGGTWNRAPRTHGRTARKQYARCHCHSLVSRKECGVPNQLESTNSVLSVRAATFF